MPFLSLSGERSFSRGRTQHISRQVRQAYQIALIIRGFQGGYRGGDEPELEKLRALHRQAREQRESIWRDRMLADALLAVRDPNAALN